MQDNFKIDYFFNKFNRSGLNHFSTVSKNKKHQRIDLKRYKSIIGNYFRIYFNELYYLKKPMYFFFGGRMQLARCGNFIFQNPKTGKYVTAGNAIGLYWNRRPCMRFWVSIDVRKMSGINNYLTKLEQDWKNHNEITLLPLLTNLIKEHRENKLLYNLTEKHENNTNIF